MTLSENAQLLRDFIIQNFERMNSQNTEIYDYSYNSHLLTSCLLITSILQNGN